MHTVVIITPEYTKGVEQFEEDSALKTVVTMFDNSIEKTIRDNMYKCRYLILTYMTQNIDHVLEWSKSTNINHIYIHNHEDDYNFIKDDKPKGYGRMIDYGGVSALGIADNFEQILGEQVYKDNLKILSDTMMGCILPRQTSFGMLMMWFEDSIQDKDSPKVINAAAHFHKIHRLANNIKGE